MCNRFRKYGVGSLGLLLSFNLMAQGSNIVSGAVSTAVKSVDEVTQLPVVKQTQPTQKTDNSATNIPPAVLVKAVKEVNEEVKGTVSELSWFSLMDSLWQADSERLAISPFSLAAVLNSARNVSSGPAQIALNNTLNTLSADKLCTGPELISADRLLLSDSLAPAENLPNFVEKIDFSSQASIDQLNTWVSKVTQNKIEKFLPGPLPETQLAFLNALSFASKWEQSFNVEDTAMESFYSTPSSKVDVPMMSAKSISAHYLDLDLVEGVKLPFAGDRYSYLAFTGKSHLTIKQILKQLRQHGDLKKVIQQGRKAEMDIKIPRHEILSDSDWVNALKTTPLSTLFTAGKVHFAGITPQAIPVTAVMQKTRLTIDEKGATAAAATAMLADRSLVTAIEFALNKPFVEMIIDQRNPALPVVVGMIERFPGETDHVQP